MSKRKLQEINAGSMADIAFLLLVFFLITTTVEMEQGISRNLPLKQELPPGYEPPPVNKRNIFEIQVNSNDQLRVENQMMIIEDLEEAVRKFYTANRNGETNPDLAKYEVIDIAKCNQKISEIQAKIDDPSQKLLLSINEGELKKWQQKLKVCKAMPGQKFNEMDNSAVVQLKNQAGTTYGIYIQIQDILKKVVVSERRLAAQDLGWDYDEIDWITSNPSESDQEKIEILRILVPERIIESKIDK